MLLYSLRYIGLANGSASKAIEGSAKLHGLIASWMTAYEQNGEPEVLAYRLEHPTTAALCYNALDGHDRQVVQYLREACSVTGSYLYLASLERRVEGSCEDEDYDDWPQNYYDEEEEHRSILEVESVTVELTKVADLNGIVLGRRIVIKDDEIIQENLFDREPDEESHEDSTATHCYKETVISSVTTLIYIC